MLSLFLMVILSFFVISNFLGLVCAVRDVISNKNNDNILRQSRKEIINNSDSLNNN